MGQLGRMLQQNQRPRMIAGKRRSEETLTWFDLRLSAFIRGPKYFPSYAVCNACTRSLRATTRVSHACKPNSAPEYRKSEASVRP